MMSHINKLSEQHVEIMAIADDIVNALGSTATLEGATAGLGLIGKLEQLLEVHLLIEDDLIYPSLRKSKNTSVRQAASLFEIELGGIRKAFGNYLAEWSVAEKIVAEHARFTTDSNALLQALRNRISREDEELFPLCNTEQ